MTILFVTVWAVVTAAHFALASRAILTVAVPEASREERFFLAAVFSTSSFSAVLHTAVMLGGLRFWTAAGLLLLLDGVLWRATRRAKRGDRAERWPIEELAGAAVIAGIGLAWIGVASASAAVLGPDAPGYHVPAAINLAHGAEFFGPTATQHLYPLAGSAVAAWFLLPFSTTLIVDAAQIAPFLIVAASVCYLLRLLIGRPALAWGAGVVLLVFSTPLFRATSLGSADLWFTAAYLAVTSVFVAALARAEWRPLDTVMAAAALGLLVGVKTTGAAAAVLLISSAAVAGAIVRPIVRRESFITSAALGAALAIGGGGVWLIRNWWLYGSPVAPTGLAIGNWQIFAGEPLGRSEYLSVAGDLARGNYALVARSHEELRRWLGTWFLPALTPMLLLPLAAWRTRSSDAGRGQRVALWMILAPGGVLVWMLTGAPWTSLEWTGGFSLRYAEPLPALLLTLSAAALAVTCAWLPRGPARIVAVAWLAAGAVMFWRAVAIGDLGDIRVPPFSVTWTLAVAAALWTFRRRDVWFAAAVVLAIAWGPILAKRDATVLMERQTEAEAEAAAFAAGQPARSLWREVYLRVKHYEQSGGRRCGTRDFVLLVRFDEPLSLQDERTSTRVFYAARGVEPSAGVSRPGACLYLVTSPAMRGTERGQALETVFAGADPATVAETDRFIVLGGKWYPEGTHAAQVKIPGRYPVFGSHPRVFLPFAPRIHEGGGARGGRRGRRNFDDRVRGRGRAAGAARGEKVGVHGRPREGRAEHIRTDHDL